VIPDHASKRCVRGTHPYSLTHGEIKRERVMEYDLRAMDREIKLIEESVGRLRELGGGIEVVERNADSILAFTYLLKRNISDVLE
jgi:hypothetical protein